jgi:hypothetical protein
LWSSPASADFPCASAGGAIGATTGTGSGVTEVTVFCANGTKEIFAYVD